MARVRASIFSRLGSRLEFDGLNVLDLFAGSGALGIEALSRGAASATFVDQAGAAIRAIQANLEKFDLKPRTQTVCAEVVSALRKLAAQQAKFDLVFLDPPYQSGAAAAALELLVEFDLLKPGAWLIAELSRREAAPDIAGLSSESVATLGDHRLALYRRMESPRE